MNILNLFNNNGVDNSFADDYAVNGIQYPSTYIIHPQLPFQARFYLNLKF